MASGLIVGVKGSKKRTRTTARGGAVSDRNEGSKGPYVNTEKRQGYTTRGEKKPGYSGGGSFAPKAKKKTDVRLRGIYDLGPKVPGLDRSGMPYKTDQQRYDYEEALRKKTEGVYAKRERQKERKKLGKKFNGSTKVWRQGEFGGDRDA